MKLKRYEGNPILAPRDTYWERMQVRNPAAWYDGERVVMIYTARTVMNTIYLGLAFSEDGYRFERASDEPWLSPTKEGFEAGTVEDARMVKIGDTYYVTYMARAIGKEEFAAGAQAKGIPADEDPQGPTWTQNWRRAALLTTRDFKTVRRLGPLTGEHIFDANVLLFPEKIGGRFCMLHRPSDYVPAEDIIEKYPPEQRPGISICFSSNLREWVDDRPLAGPVFPWENYKIGGSSQPIRTDRGWLVLYHAVGGPDPAHGVYRVGAMMLDLADPTRVIARAPEPILEPEEPWEREGTVPMVVFPNSAVVIDGTLFVYYGGADTVTAVATANLRELTDFVMRYPTA
jgi:beta-1,2-mannobiose phosphorylase / 1,2-beta-oligomannan phosphorylase